jgi:hypothetical protein
MGRRKKLDAAKFNVGDYLPYRVRGRDVRRVLAEYVRSQRPLAPVPAPGQKWRTYRVPFELWKRAFNRSGEKRRGFFLRRLVATYLSGAQPVCFQTPRSAQAVAAPRSTHALRPVQYPPRPAPRVAPAPVRGRVPINSEQAMEYMRRCPVFIGGASPVIRPGEPLYRVGKKIYCGDRLIADAS